MSYWFALRIAVAVTLAVLSGKVLEEFWLSHAHDDTGWRILLIPLILTPAIGLVGAGSVLSGRAYAAVGLLAAIASGLGGGAAMMSLDKEILPRNAFIGGFGIAAVSALAGLVVGSGLLFWLRVMRRGRVQSH